MTTAASLGDNKSLTVVTDVCDEFAGITIMDKRPQREP